MGIYFNPRSRVGNDRQDCMSSIVENLISIHVPAWGTTNALEDTITFSDISIHVPAWGTTGLHQAEISVYRNFNPRSRVGNDGICVKLWIDFLVISIHVPAWGTTPITFKRLCRLAFQSTFPRGERPRARAFFAWRIA